MCQLVVKEHLQQLQRATNLPLLPLLLLLLSSGTCWQAFQWAS
jgi:hypothetical protein